MTSIRTILAAALVAATTTGCVSVVLSDSNGGGFGPFGAPVPGLAGYWPARVVMPPGYTLDDAAVPSMSATAERVCSSNPFVFCTANAQCPAGGTCDARLLADGLPADGGWRLDRLIEKYSGTVPVMGITYQALACALAGAGKAPRFTLALGTNDLPNPLLTGQQIGLADLALVDRARAAFPCVVVAIAELPSRVGFEAKVQQANTTIRIGMLSRGGAGRVIAFGSLPESFLWDGTHATYGGQGWMAAAAQAVLFPGLGGPTS